MAVTLSVTVEGETDNDVIDKLVEMARLLRQAESRNALKNGKRDGTAFKMMRGNDVFGSAQIEDDRNVRKMSAVSCHYCGRPIQRVGHGWYHQENNTASCGVYAVDKNAEPSRR